MLPPLRSKSDEPGEYRCYSCTDILPPGKNSFCSNECNGRYVAVVMNNRRDQASWEKMKKKEARKRVRRSKGFTLMELFVFLGIICGIAWTGFVIWAIVHFTAKYW